MRFHDIVYAIYRRIPFVDAINQTAVTVDIQEKLADTKNVDIRKLVAYAIAGAGLQYASSEILRKVSDEEMDVLKAQFRRWLNGSDPKKFFRNLFITNGYRCEEVIEFRHVRALRNPTQLFLRCEHGGTELSCCKIFEPRFIMKRGRWFKLKQINQTAPNHYGQLSVTLGMLPSWILTPDGFQVRTVCERQSSGILELTKRGGDEIKEMTYNGRFK